MERRSGDTAKHTDRRLISCRSFYSGPAYRIMKHFKKLVSFLAILSCLAGSVVPLPAAASGRTVPRVTFTNQPNQSPDLYVTKRVTGGTQEQKYDQFQFVLKVGGEVAAGREYRLYELREGGRKEIVKTDKNGNRIPFETDGSGVFQLEADQQAHFEVLGAGIRYEVEELGFYRTPKTDPQTGEILEVKEKPYILRYKGPVDENGKEISAGSVLHGEYQYRPVSLSQGGYAVTSPSGGKTGVLTMPVAGDAVSFTNRYTPVGTGEKTTLNVHKSITFPDNWKTPVTPDFRFRLEIDDNEYLPATYTASNAATGETRQEHTDKDGYFTLKGGWTAIFEEVPAGVDYRLCEITDDAGADENGSGWQPTGSVVHQGSTTAPEMNLDFNNSNLAFLVTKTLDDSQKPDVDFDFRLADAQNNGLEGETFYLYRTTGEPVYLDDLTPEENEAQGNEAGPAVNTEQGKTIILRRTGPDGTFTLKPGQAAVFVGMKEGTVCQVTETGAPGYVQMLPLPGDNDPITINSSGEVQRVDFVNKALETDGTLTIQKKVINPTGEGSLTQRDFRFVLCQRLQTKAELVKALKLPEGADRNTVDDAVQAGLTDGSLTGAVSNDRSGMTDGNPADAWESNYYYEADGNTYEIYIPLSGQIYRVPEGLNPATYKTGPNQELGLGAGEFFVRDGQTVQFDGLTGNARYLVREVQIPSEYREVISTSSAGDPGLPAYGKLYGGADDEDIFAQTLTLTGSGVHAVFTNEYTPEKVDLALTKVNDSGEMLSGAEFMLYLEKGREPANKVLPQVLPDGVTAEEFCYATEADGTVNIPDLKPGTYWLYETRAPHTYSLLRDPIELTVERTGEGTLQVLINGVLYTEDTEIPDSSVSRVTLTDRGEGRPKAQIGLTVLNVELYDLPNSGGMGIYWYLISGILLMMAAALILYRNNIRGRC